MNDDERRPRRDYPLSPAKMSKAPSWTMLGFVLGAVTVWSMLPHLRKDAPRPPQAASKPAVEPAKAKAPVARSPLTTIEAVFGDWDRYAVWDNDTTEVALWNAEAGAYSDSFEVLRYAGRYYFRSIPALTRRPITRGKHVANSPLLFTETEEQYQEWKQHGRSERPIGDYRPLTAFPPAATDDPRKTAAPKPQVAAPPGLETFAPFQPPPVKTAEPRK